MSTRLNIICMWICFILLLILGVVMVASTGTCVPGQEKLVWYKTFLGKQCIFALLGLAVAIGMSCVDYRRLRRPVYWFWGLCVLLLICCPGRFFSGCRWH